MRDFVDGSAFNFEQGQRARKLFAAVVLAALDDAIADDKKYGSGPEQVARWARSLMYSTFFLRISRTAWSVLSGVQISEIDRCIPVDKVTGARNPG